MELRPATLFDEQLLYRWRVQDEEGDWWQGDPVDEEGHHAWFRDRLMTPAVDLWIATVDGKPVGQVRTDSNGEISVSVQHDERRRGYGLQMLTIATERAWERHGRVKACIDQSNLPAAELFAQAGYRRRKDVTFWRFPK